MGKKIIVAGAGHGGIVAGALLAEKGYEVTVYERLHRKELGYDWLDAFDPKLFDEFGLPHIKEGTYGYNGDMLFFNPAMTAPILVPAEGGHGSAKIERKYIYNAIIKFAKSKGVKFKYNVTVLGPIMDGLRVVGLETTSGKVFGDLVIDACGIDSPVRKNLPNACDVQRDYEYGDCFYGYRAYYNKIADAPAPACDYEVYLVHMGEQGISWNVTEEDSVDVLIGRMYPFTEAQREEALEEMRKHNPQLGTELVRGGQLCKIPIANPLPVMVCDGYACIGDAAYMTQPMNGSGLVASFKAAKMLAETVEKDEGEEYSAATLWEYNYTYIKEIGAAFASVGILKNVMLSLTAGGIDFLFEKQIITQSDLSFYESTGMSFPDLVGRATRGIARLPVLLKTAGGLSRGSSTKDVYKSIPKKYSRSAVRKWQDSVREAHVSMAR